MKTNRIPPRDRIAPTLLALTAMALVITGCDSGTKGAKGFACRMATWRGARPRT